MGIKEFVSQRRIKSLYHFTSLQNLESILNNGLLSRDKLKENNILHYYNDNLRLENKLNAICVSISFPNYKMFYRCGNTSSSVTLTPNVTSAILIFPLHVFM